MLRNKDHLITHYSLTAFYIWLHLKTLSSQQKLYLSSLSMTRFLKVKFRLETGRCPVRKTNPSLSLPITVNGRESACGIH